MRKLVGLGFFLSFLSGISACGGGGPEGLARKLESALKAGDMDAVLAQIDSRSIPAQVLFFYMDTVPDCFEAAPCRVTVEPLPADFKQESARQGEEEGAAFAVAPEGMIKIASEAPGKDGKSKGGGASMTMPYANVGGQYKVVAMSLVPAKVARLRSESAQAVADALLAEGVGDPPDKEWKGKATALPPGGGEAGRLFAESGNAMAAAGKANDVKAIVVAGGPWAEVVFADNDFAGHSVSLKKRQLKLRAQSVRFVSDIKVLGGYALNGVHALIYEGRDGAGWIVRGCAIGEIKGGKWEVSAKRESAAPPG